MAERRTRRDGKGGDLDFPWEDEAFLDEDTSEYPEVEETANRLDTVARAPSFPPPGITDPAEGTDPAVEGTDPVFEDTDRLVEHAPVPTRALTPAERFFPDVPELARDDEGSQVSGLLRAADEISRIITPGRRGPGPVVRWYLSLPPVHRRWVYKGSWMLGASLLIVTLFTLATLGIFPLVEGRFTASFGPRPDRPQRSFPEPGEAFGLVEDRPYRHDRFIAGLDCIWVTSDPVLAPQIAAFGPYLQKNGEVTAVLDVEPTWNGMSRLYFDRGKIPMDEPLDLVIPIRDGGSFPLSSGPGYRVRLPGGTRPARAILGPLVFRETTDP
ncbi:MAG: hypothetical protein FJ098_14160 [Deltaproteobacteria bacterium]|nr:hypothetical protein [Deltaproteobacteria bacterium]